jgi:hypothetical protein
VRIVARRTGGAALGGILLALCVGCEGVVISLPFDEVDQTAAQKEYTLRYKRTKGAADRYQATYRVRVRTNPEKSGYLTSGEMGAEVDEDITATLVYYVTGKTEGAEQYDRVVIRRKDEERKRLQVSASGKVTQIDKLLDVQPRVTPNIAPEPSASRRSIVYIPMNDLGCIARSKRFPYHYAWDDSLCYMFPVFPKAAVRIGASWEYSFPAIVGTEFANNVLTIKAVFRFVDIIRLKVPGEKKGPLCALIEYE